jgi:hypothetical protein
VVEFFSRLKKTKQYDHEKKRPETELVTFEMQAVFLVLKRKQNKTERNIKRQKKKWLTKSEVLASISSAHRQEVLFILSFIKTRLFS